MTAGHIYDIGGDGRSWFPGDGGPATAAELDRAGRHRGGPRRATSCSPTAGNDRVRLIVGQRSGTFYGQPMTAGGTTPSRASGNDGFSGDGGPATAADLSLTPQGDGKIDLSEPWPMLRIDHWQHRAGRQQQLPHPRGGRPDRHVLRPEDDGDDIYTIAGNGPRRGFSRRDWPPGPRAGPELGVDHRGGGGRRGQRVPCSDMGSITLRGQGRHPGSGRGGQDWGGSYGISMRAGGKAHLHRRGGDGELGTSGNGGLATRAKFAGRPASPWTARATSWSLTARAKRRPAGRLHQRPGRGPSRPVGGGTTGAVRMIPPATSGEHRAAPDSGYTGNGGPAYRAEIDNGHPDTPTHLLRTPGRPGGPLTATRSSPTSTAGRSWSSRARTGRFYGIAMRSVNIYSVAGGAPDSRRRPAREQGPAPPARPR